MPVFSRRMAAPVSRVAITLCSRPRRIEASTLAAARSTGIGFDSQSVVYSGSELLFASEVALRGLDGDVSEQELDLIQFAAGEMAETGAGAPQVVRGQLVDPGASRCRADHIPQHLGDIPSLQTRPALLIARNTGPSVIAAAAVHASTAAFTQVGIGTVRT
jgi:hypothetical protein